MRADISRVIERAIAARARVAVLPCCHHLAARDAAAFSGWVDGPVAIDIMRAMRLANHGYRIWTQAIPADITPKNRLLLGAPAATHPFDQVLPTRPAI